MQLLCLCSSIISAEKKDHPQAFSLSKAEVQAHSQARKARLLGLNFKRFVAACCAPAVLALLLLQGVAEMLHHLHTQASSYHTFWRA